MATARNSEDDFLRVLEEMNRICGEEEEAEDLATASEASEDQINNNSKRQSRKLSQEGHKSSVMSPASDSEIGKKDDEVRLPASEDDSLEDIFVPVSSSASSQSPASKTTSSAAPLIGDQVSG